MNRIVSNSIDGVQDYISQTSTRIVWSLFILITLLIHLTPYPHETSILYADLVKDTYISLAVLYILIWTILIIFSFHPGTENIRTVTPFSSTWIKSVVQTMINGILFVIAVPYVIWGSPITPTIAVRTLPTIEQTLLWMSGLFLLLGPLILGAGIRAYLTITKSRYEKPYLRVTEVLKDNNVKMSEIPKMAELLVTRDKYEYISILDYSDITKEANEWRWNIPPEEIRQQAKNPNLEISRELFPVTKESHRRWRIVGGILICIGIVVQMVYTGNGIEGLLFRVTLGVILGYGLLSMMFGKFLP